MRERGGHGAARLREDEVSTQLGVPTEPLALPRFEERRVECRAYVERTGAAGALHAHSDRVPPRGQNIGDEPVVLRSGAVALARVVHVDTGELVTQHHLVCGYAETRSGYAFHSRSHAIESVRESVEAVKCESAGVRLMRSCAGRSAARDAMNWVTMAFVPLREETIPRASREFKLSGRSVNLHHEFAPHVSGFNIRGAETMAHVSGFNVCHWSAALGLLPNDSAAAFALLVEAWRFRFDFEEGPHAEQQAADRRQDAWADGTLTKLL